MIQLPSAFREQPMLNIGKCELVTSTPAIANLLDVKTKYEHLANNFLNVRNTLSRLEYKYNFASKADSIVFHNSVEIFFATIHEQRFSNTSVEDSLFVFAFVIFLFRDHKMPLNHRKIPSFKFFYEEFGELCLTDYSDTTDPVAVHVRELLNGTSNGYSPKTGKESIERANELRREILQGYVPEIPGPRLIK